MSWPTPQDYNEAAQSPGVVFADPELKKAVPETTKLGLPKAITGNFACVYRFAAGKKEWAVRCFHRRYAGRRDRYVQISRALADLKLPYTVPFDYIHEGIRLRGRWYPIIKMEWVRGPLLAAYVEKNLSNPKAIRTLADEWLRMISTLRGAGIAHGDLQHGNVLVVGGRIRLVDYDGMYVPALAGMGSNETGHPNYQHPHRMGSQFGPDLDNFSSWVIYLSLAALAADPTLLEMTTRGDEALVFCKKDFEHPAQSRAFGLLKACKDARVRSLAKRFQDIVRRPPSQVPALDAKAAGKRVPKAAARPASKPVPTAAPPRPASPPAPAPTPPKPRSKPTPKPAPLSTPPVPAPPASSLKPSPAPAPTAQPPGPAHKPPPGAWYLQPAAGPAPSISSTPVTTGAPGAKPLVTPAPGRAWRLAAALARAAFVVVKWTLVCLWWILKALAWTGYLFIRTFMWRLPARALGLLAESYRKLPPPRRRRVQIAGAFIVVTLSATAYLWHDRLAAVFAGLASGITGANHGPQEEMCEFLADRAARLYIDGELASREVPPPHRTALSVGDHTVRFVSQSGFRRGEKGHEITIQVAPGRPGQWFMDFADGQVKRRDLSSAAR